MTWQKFLILLKRLVKGMWFRATLFSLLAGVAAIISIFLEPHVPFGFSKQIGADSIDHILTIIASSMLSVTTFSLGVAVTAYNSAASAATPRATALLVEDATTQNVLATFVGAFLFSLVGIVVLRMGAYGGEGRIGLYFMTIAVIIIIVGTLLRWIGHLTTIGRMGDTLDRVEKATLQAFETRLSNPYLGCQPLPHGYRLPRGNHEVYAETIGYVQYIDTAALNDLATEWDTQFSISALPGTFVDPSRAIIYSEKSLDGDEIVRVCGCFSIGNDRTFEQDPRFGVIVLSEIASRALSPAVNDPGTAIGVIGRLVRVLHRWDQRRTDDEMPEVRYTNVYVPGLRTSDLFDDAFTSIGRDGAGMLEVNVRLQKAFASLAFAGSEDVREQVARHADLALHQARLALKLEEHLGLLQTLRVENQRRDSMSGTI